MIADRLVAEQLAACVSLLPGVTSVYRWEGEVETATEVMLLIKAATSDVEALSTLIASVHPYELPEVIAVDISGGLPAYLAWIQEKT